MGGPFIGGRTITELVSLIDLPVTLLDCAGIKKPEDFQGNSLKSLADGTSKGWDDCVFIQISESEVGRAIRTDQWKYAVAADADGWSCPGADVYYEQYLFDLEHDPAECCNLAGDPAFEPARRVLREKLLLCMERAGEKRPEIRPFREG